MLRPFLLRHTAPAIITVITLAFTVAADGLDEVGGDDAFTPNFPVVLYVG